MPSGAPTVSSRTHRPISPYRARRPGGSLQGSSACCFQCGSTSHRQAQCPQRVVGITDKHPISKDDEDVEVSIPTNEMFLEIETDLERQRQEQ